MDHIPNNCFRCGSELTQQEKELSYDLCNACWEITHCDECGNEMEDEEDHELRICKTCQDLKLQE